MKNRTGLGASRKARAKVRIRGGLAARLRRERIEDEVDIAAGNGVDSRGTAVLQGHDLDAVGVRGTDRIQLARPRRVPHQDEFIGCVGWCSRRVAMVDGLGALDHVRAGRDKVAAVVIAMHLERLFGDRRQVRHGDPIAEVTRRLGQTEDDRPVVRSLGAGDRAGLAVAELGDPLDDVVVRGLPDDHRAFEGGDEVTRRGSRDPRTAGRTAGPP